MAGICDARGCAYWLSDGVGERHVLCRIAPAGRDHEGGEEGACGEDHWGDGAVRLPAHSRGELLCARAQWRREAPPQHCVADPHSASLALPGRTHHRPGQVSMHAVHPLMACQCRNVDGNYSLRV
jgi:hypothetical protein